MSETSGHPSPGTEGRPPHEATPVVARAAEASGWKTFAQVALIVAAVLLVQRVLLPRLGIGT